jgi:hypothetical protein
VGSPGTGILPKSVPSPHSIHPSIHPALDATSGSFEIRVLLSLPRHQIKIEIRVFLHRFLKSLA